MTFPRSHRANLMPKQRRSAIALAFSISVAGASPGVPAFAAAPPAPAAPAAGHVLESPPPKIPLCAGLTIVTAIQQREGDYESIKRVQSVTRDGVRIKYSSEAWVKDEDSDDPGKLVRTTVFRTVRTEDLVKAKLYEQEFSDRLPEIIPGTTAIGTSTAILNALKFKGTAETGIFITFTGEPTLEEGSIFNIFNNKMEAPVTRVEPHPAMLPVIVNGVPTRLPTIHASGEFQGDNTEFYFLDDPANPITIRFRYGIDALTHVDESGHIAKGDANGKADRAVLQVIKITARCENSESPNRPAGPSVIEESLARTGKAEVYDIYFSFNSATIREESEPSLKEIAGVMTRHSDWKLDVSGHTDSLGRAAYNLDLSKKRAAAVQAALVSRYHVDAHRLAADGYGASQPQDTNATLEGRARNRRVELIRQ